MSYTCIIGELKNVRRFPGADRIQLANCFNSQVVVGLEAKEGDIVLFFDADGQLSEQYCYENNLYNKGEMNKDPEKKGFFDHKRRVRCQAFRGEKSEAYVASLESLVFTGYDISTLSIGDKFDELNSVPICNKYITKATKGAVKNNTQSGFNKKNLKKFFPEHMDTDQLRFALDQNLVGLVTITAKVHGTSQRTGYVKFPKELPLAWYEKLWNKFVGLINKLPPKWANEDNHVNAYFHHKVDMSYRHIYGTRRVIKGQIKETDNDYRTLCAKKLIPFIQKGEIWYYEIVGYEDTGKPIMQTVSTNDTTKEFKERFGTHMTYKYGCTIGTCDIYVYRITYQNEDGIVYELPWSQVKAKCNNAGVKHVPEVNIFVVKTEDEVKKLKDTIAYYVDATDIADPIDPSHIKEGYCIRVDNLETGKTKIYKEKLYWFKVLEGIIKSDDTYVDTEESEG